MQNNIDTTRRDMVEKLLSKERATGSDPYQKGTLLNDLQCSCANDGGCSPTCGWTWRPFVG